MMKTFRNRLSRLKQDRRAVWLGYVLIGAGLAVLPFAIDGGLGRTWVRIVDFALIYAMLALGLNIVVGLHRVLCGRGLYLGITGVTAIRPASSVLDDSSHRCGSRSIVRRDAGHADAAVAR